MNSLWRLMYIPKLTNLLRHCDLWSQFPLDNLHTMQNISRQFLSLSLPLYVTLLLFVLISLIFEPYFLIRTTCMLARAALLTAVLIKWTNEIRVLWAIEMWTFSFFSRHLGRIAHIKKCTFKPVFAGDYMKCTKTMTLNLFGEHDKNV